MGIKRLNNIRATEKQRGFETDFTLDAETYEVWDEIEVGRVATATQTFLVKEEDILSWNRSTLEEDPLFVDPEAARAQGHDHVIAHPLFNPMSVSVQALLQLIEFLQHIPYQIHQTQCLRLLAVCKSHRTRAQWLYSFAECQAILTQQATQFTRRRIAITEQAGTHPV